MTTWNIKKGVSQPFKRHSVQRINILRKLEPKLAGEEISAVKLYIHSTVLLT